MSYPIFSRAFLQALPVQYKQEYMDTLTKNFINELKNAAIAGKTSYVYKLSRLELDKSSTVYNPKYSNFPILIVTNADLILYFKQKFPDCDVSYEEKWVDVDSDTRVLSKSVIIDWS